MQHRYKIMLVALFTVVASGCASTNSTQATDDFIDGATNNAEHRQQRQNNNLYGDDEELKKEDTLVGIFNIGLQSIVRLFKSADPE